MKNESVVFGAAMILVLASVPAVAVDGMAIEAGTGDGTDMARIAVQRDWNRRWCQGGNWHLGGYWDLGLGQWHHSGSAPGRNDDITEIGLTPVFRIQRNDLRGVYFEAGLGAHVLSRTSIGDTRLSIRFQFGSHWGLGMRFGAKGEYDLSYRYQHLSNADIRKPNGGIDFNQIRLQYHF